MSWSETGPILVTKMSVLTSVTRSVEAGNCQSEWLSVAFIIPKLLVNTMPPGYSLLSIESCQQNS